jgi:E3 ubiquitin-protein ligase HUWE1
MLVLDILHFTALLIEHSYSRHLYNSIEYLIMLLQSSDVHIVLGVLSLLYVFSKRSNFITRLQLDKKQALIGRLIFLAEVKDLKRHVYIYIFSLVDLGWTREWFRFSSLL